MTTAARAGGHGLFARAEALAVAGVLVPLGLIGFLAWRSVDDLTAARLADRGLLLRVVAERLDEALRHDVELVYRAGGHSRAPDRGVAAGRGGAAPAEPPSGAVAAALRKSSEALDGLFRLEIVDASGAVVAPADGTREASGERVLSAEAPLSLAPWRVVLSQSEDEALAPTRTFRAALLILTPSLAGFAALFAWGAARSVKAPLATLTEAAERIAAGELDRPLPELSQDEVGRLGRSLETMRAALASAVGELERRVAERTARLEVLSNELRVRDERRGELLRKLISTQEEERKRIARELHDETCQTLSALMMRIDADGKSHEPAELRALAGRTLDGVHRLIRDLRPSMLDDLGLVPALRAEVARRLSPLGIAVRFEVEGLDERLPRDVETLLYRIVQEAITNVVRHASAESVLVQLAREGPEISIEIEDDGVGFDPASVETPGESGRGLGLLGMRERVELLGGALEVDSAPGDGTRVAVKVRLQ